MASTFPTAVDTFSTPTAGSATSSPSHSTLHVNENDAIIAAQTYMGLVLVKSQTIGTAVSSVAVTGAFSATYDNYLVTIAGGVASTSVSLDMTLGSAVTGYKWCLVYTAWGATVFSDADAAAAKMRYVGRGDTNSLGASITVMSPFLSKNTRVTGTAISNSDTGSSYGMLFDSTSYTSFNIVLNTGTMTGGTIRVYGYRQ